ncbi:hypothetical protein HYPSUDRAFT_768666 [Hypholoma sublateritium FD-334 SS-4]|uniref:Uncharacterized protein n=1 Tax=Hypholoma sublateritium (strain FD-334 SS-4) TaxID=945553 RepID=A0A0D2L2E3_HYPSF|nr:hypothetical protein HYPSUDRAFT_768666 [Hypholoma sublateritium FD-334 SS-4]
MAFKLQARLPRSVAGVNLLLGMISYILIANVPRRWSEQPPPLKRACLACIGRPTVTHVALGGQELADSDLLPLLSRLASEEVIVTEKAPFDRASVRHAPTYGSAARATHQLRGYARLRRDLVGQRVRLP